MDFEEELRDKNALGKLLQYESSIFLQLGILPSDEYSYIAERFSIPALDICIFDPSGLLLMACRENTPGQGSYFVPGGRIFKNETQSQALERILEAEGLSILKSNAKKFIHCGVFDHLYKDGPLCSQYCSHYIVNAYKLMTDSIISSQILGQIQKSPQHKDGSWKWINSNDQFLSIHPYSRQYFH